VDKRRELGSGHLITGSRVLWLEKGKVEKSYNSFEKIKCKISDLKKEKVTIRINITVKK
jgi:hypothetical protein